MEAYTQWVKERIEDILFPFPFGPSMNIQQSVLIVVPTSEVGKLKDTFKSLEKENTDLRSNLGRLTREKEDLELNLNQKRALTLQAVEEAQEEQFKRRKAGDALKGIFDSLFVKKKQLTYAQYQAYKREISF